MEEGEEEAEEKEKSLIESLPGCADISELPLPGGEL